jgi:hypothetical protein
MRALYGLTVFVGTAISLLVLMGALGGVGSVELLLAVVLAAAHVVVGKSIPAEPHSTAATISRRCVARLPGSMHAEPDFDRELKRRVRPVRTSAQGSRSGNGVLPGCDPIR